jgi:hypothetical protein
VTSPGTGGNPQGYLDMHFDGAAFPTIEQDFLVTQAPDYVGDYTGRRLNFNFLGYPSSACSVYFESTAGGGSVWVQDFTVDMNGWMGVDVGFGNGSAWTRISGPEDNFALALTQVSEIGVAIQHLNTGIALDYGIDNWQAYVPEPGAVAMYLTALISTLVVCRTQIRSGMVRVKRDAVPLLRALARC